MQISAQSAFSHSRAFNAKVRPAFRRTRNRTKYAYNPGTHQVSSITGTVNGVTNPTFTYDNNGNLTSEDGVATTWSSFNMATSITRGSASDAFTYSSEHSRVKDVATSSSGTVTTIYVSPSFEVVSNTATGTTEYHNYINSSTRRVAMLIDSTASTTSWRYFHQDQIGSTDAVTDQTGAIVERLSYDAFGRRRNTNGTDSTTFIQAQDSYGYTDQEELDSIGLINMNGRIYDPTIGRFMSADPTIPRPFDLQSHNRYAYASNRPFVRVDPTGFTDDVPSDYDDGSGGGGDGDGNYAPPDPPTDETPPKKGPSGPCLSCDWVTTYVGSPSTPPSDDPSSGVNLNGANPASNSGDNSGAGTGQTGDSGTTTPTDGIAPNDSNGNSDSAGGMTIFGTPATGSASSAPSTSSTPTATADPVPVVTCGTSPCLNVYQTQGLQPNQLYPGSLQDLNGFLAIFVPSGSSGVIVQQATISGPCTGCTNTTSGDSFYEAFNVASGQTKDYNSMMLGSQATVTLTATYYPNASMADLEGQGFVTRNPDVLQGHNGLPSSLNPPTLPGPSSNSITRTQYYNF